jgi:hypothetical protein
VQMKKWLQLRQVRRTDHDPKRLKTNGHKSNSLKEKSINNNYNEKATCEERNQKSKELI